MPSIYNKICERFLTWCVYLANLFGYKMLSNNIKASSFVIDENIANIEIIEVNRSIDQNNLINYLKHHIMFTDDKFKIEHFHEPLIVRFKFQNEIYKIHLKHLISKNTDHSVSINDAKYLSAVIKNHDHEEGIYITDLLVELHGPERNFFSHIPDVISDLSVLLKEYKNNGKLYTFDMLGNQKIIEL